MARTPKVVEDRKEQILDAAMRVFAQKGFTRATNKDIAREAGITPGLIYYYFESKEAVFKEIVEQRSPLSLIGTFSEEMLALPPEQFLRYFIGRVLTIIEDEQFIGIIRVVLPEVVHEVDDAGSQIARTARDVFQRIVTFLRTYLEAKMASRELEHGDAQAASQLLFSSTIGFLMRRQILRDPTVVDLTREQIADVITNAVIKSMASR